MKTNQVMLRQMGVFQVEQRTSDGFFNATSLMKQWNDTYPNKKRDIDNFWRSTNLVELMSEIAEYELDIKSVDFTDLKQQLSKTSRGANGGTWMHAVLFIKWAMYLNPRFEYHVLRFVADQMIQYRRDAGDAHKVMCSALSKIPFSGNIYKEVSAALNFVIFNHHEKMIRNKVGDEKTQRELFELEKIVATLVNDGFLKSIDDIKNYLRKKWCERWEPKMFLSQKNVVI